MGSCHDCGEWTCDKHSKLTYSTPECPYCEIDRLKARIAELEEKLAQIHICADNALRGRLDMDDALNSIEKVSSQEGGE